MYHPLGNGWGMGPAERKRQQGVGVLGSANADTSNGGSRETNAPKAIGKVKGGDARGRGRRAGCVKQGTNLKESGETKFGWW